MPQPPKISAIFQKKHEGEVAISLEGKVIAVGKNAVVAFKKAQKKVPNLEEEEFLISRIHHKYLAA